jgi:hypothetical protein
MEGYLLKCFTPSCDNHYHVDGSLFIFLVTTLASPSQRAWKGEGWECNPRVTFTLLGMQESVRKWAHMLPSGLPLWELESWRTPKFLDSNLRGQNSLDWKVSYTIRKILKPRCLKWVCMIHWNTYNTSYGRKKGQKSKCQFDSWPLKSRITLNYVRVGGAWHIFGRFLTRATILL